MNKVLIGLMGLAMSATAVCAQSLHTTDAASDFERGYTMYCDGNYSGCLDVMNSLLRREEAAMYYEEAAFYVAMSQAQRAIDRTPELLTGYLHKYPYSLHRSEIDLAMGNYYYSVGEYEEAIEAYIKIDIDNIKSSEQDDFCYRLAHSYVKINRTNEAQPLLQALAQNSRQYRNEALYYNGYIYYEQKNYKSARRNLSMVQSNSEYGFEAQYLLVNIDFINNKYAQCIATSEQLLDLCSNPKHTSELHRIAGESHYQLGNDNRAYYHLSRHLKLAESPMRNTLYMAGILSYRNKQYNEAVELLARTIEPDDAVSQNAHLHRGLAYLQLGDRVNASTSFALAAGSNHDATTREVAMYNQAMCAYENNFSLFDSTLDLFKKFIEEYPTSIYIDDVNTCISDLYVNSRNYATALDYINRIKEPSRDMLKQRQQILYLLGTESFANNSISEAADWFAQAIKAGNYAPEYRARSIYWLGECCYRNKAYKEALKCYNQFLNIDITTDATIVALAQYNKAYCYFKTKRYDEALTAFDNFIRNKKADKALLIDANSRVGDCYFHAEEYTTAEKYYSAAANLKGRGSDYAILQQAVVAGVRKKNKQKISLLQKLISDYPQSEYNEEAYSELGQTYIAIDSPTEAINTYRQLMEKYPMSVSARNAMLQLGALYYNRKDLGNSITAYKSLITGHPTSNEAKVAIEDLKSIYIELNQVDELSEFMQQQGIRYETNELDSLSYLAAERKYMTQGDTQPLEKYIARFPQGTYTFQAYYYLGNVADAQQQYEVALACYRNSLQANPHSDFAQEATMRCCDILFDKGQYAESAPLYRQLETMATTIETRQNARLGAMRSYAHLQQYEEVISVADRLMAHSKISPEVEQEVLFYRAQAYMACNDAAAALIDYSVLAQDTRSQYGAEAAFRLAEYYYNNEQLEEAEQAANDFVQKGTQHAYWLARNFILLSDIYVAKDDKYTAQQYLLQLRDSYPGGDDDITLLIEKRLQQLL